MPPTWSAAAKRSLCWGSAVTWPPYGLSWGFWPRSSSWSSSLLFMRSVRSRRIYKTVSHQSRCLGLFYYCTVFCISEGKLVFIVQFWHGSLLWTWCKVFFFFASKKPVSVLHFLFGCPLKSFLVRRRRWSHPTLFLRSIIQSGEVDPRQTLLQKVAPCQDNFMHLIFMRNMILQCCGGGQVQLLMAFPRNLLCARAAASLTTRHSFSYTTCACHPRIA